MSTSTQVLVVGAGPVGTVLACELTQQGVRVRLIDRDERAGPADPHSRAILVWPRSLEVLRRIGASEALVAAGHRSSGVRYYSGGRLLGTADLGTLADSPYPFVLALPQSRTEQVLRRRLAELGGAVEHGVTLVDLDDTGERPVATLRHADGTIERATADYVVGADGPASAVRTLLGIRFDGDPVDVTYAIGDVVVGGPAPADLQYYYSRHGVVALVPLGGGRFRIAANVPHRDVADGPPPRELLQRILDERARVPLTITDLLWTRSFRPRLGLAETFQKGRCFLAGDAAHVISPAGGQGMNVGFQDAVNLGWRLGGVLRGRLPATALSGYDPERRAAAARMSRTSAAQARFALQRGTARIALRDAAFIAGRAAGLVRRILVPLLSQTDVHYGSAGTHPLAWRRGPVQPGQRVPLAGMPPLAPYAFTMLLWPGSRTPTGWAAAVARLRSKAPADMPVHDLAATAGQARRALRRALGARPRVAVVRPDGHLSRLTPLHTT